MSNPTRTSIHKRKSKVSVEDLAPTPGPLSLFFLERFPNILAAKDLKEIVDRTLTAVKNKRPVICTFGAHVIKCGLSPIICELLRADIITCLATNGASVVHDVELALYGHTSEDVAEGLLSGGFGTTEETLDFINNSVNNLCSHGYGIGQAIGYSLKQANAPYRHKSIFYTGLMEGSYPKVHISMGTDVYQMRTNFKAKLWASGSMDDFWSLAVAIHNATNGGVILNFGSAVMMPEIILKAVALGRAQGLDFSGITMADFDMNKQYRPMTRIVETANLLGGKGYHITSHHELILPLLGGLLLGGIKDE